MKLYRHYKNKPYTYVGLAKHSETLEDMVIYETRYENALGKVWVRPKTMFFETVDVGGVQIPRFKKIPMEIVDTTDVTADKIDTVAPIIERSFGQWDAKWFYSKFNDHQKFFLVIAWVQGQAVAFKLGYERTEKKFHSWLGGVTPEFRGLGIAQDLMNHQHDWCKAQGYTKISTKTQNRFREMLVLNIKNGFNVVGIDSDSPDGEKILLEKIL